jgi:ribosomal protein L44E
MGMASTSKIRKPPGEGELAEKRAARRVSSGPRPVWKQEVRAKHTGRLATNTTCYACTYASAMDPCVHRRQSSLREAVYAVSHAQSFVYTP